MIKIISPDSGSALGTKFIDTDTGEEIPLSVSMKPPATLTFDGIVTLQATIGLVQYEGVAGRVEWMMEHPIKHTFQPVASVSFRDGVEMVLQEDGKVVVVDTHA